MRDGVIQHAVVDKAAAVGRQHRGAAVAQRCRIHAAAVGVVKEAAVDNAIVDAAAAGEAQRRVLMSRRSAGRQLAINRCFCAVGGAHRAAVRVHHFQRRPLLHRDAGARAVRAQHYALAYWLRYLVVVLIGVDHVGDGRAVERERFVEFGIVAASAEVAALQLLNQPVVVPLQIAQAGDVELTAVAVQRGHAERAAVLGDIIDPVRQIVGIFRCRAGKGDTVVRLPVHRAAAAGGKQLALFRRHAPAVGGGGGCRAIDADIDIDDAVAHLRHAGIDILLSVDVVVVGQLAGGRHRGERADIRRIKNLQLIISAAVDVRHANHIILRAERQPIRANNIVIRNNSAAT